MDLMVSDLDGTLLHNKTISKNNLLAIDAWKESGNVFTVATGRSFSRETKKYIEAMDIRFPVILCNGNMIYYPEENKTIVSNYISWTYIVNLMERLKRQGLLENIVLYGEDKNYSINPSELLINKLDSWGAKYEVVNDSLPRVSKVISILIYSSPRIISEIFQLGLSEENVEVFNTSSNVIDIIPKGISKGNALRKVLSEYEFERIIVVGDSKNDLSLAFDANVVVAVGNAVGELKELAHYIVDDCESDAIYDLIYRHLEVSTNYSESTS